jgi:hypothetical protein
VIPLRQHGAGLDGGRGKPLIVEAALHYNCGTRHDSLDRSSILARRCDVVRTIEQRGGRRRERGIDAYHCIQRVDGLNHALGAVFGRVAIAGQDDCHRFARETNTVSRQRWSLHLRRGGLAGRNGGKIG